MQELHHLYCDHDHSELENVSRDFHFFCVSYAEDFVLLPFHDFDFDFDFAFQKTMV